MSKIGHDGRMVTVALLFLLALGSALAFLILRLRGCAPLGW
jgi:hypothetical protein